MPEDVYTELSLRTFYVELIAEEEIKLLIFNPLTNTIVSWTN